MTVIEWNRIANLLKKFYPFALLGKFANSDAKDYVCLFEHICKAHYKIQNQAVIFLSPMRPALCARAFGFRGAPSNP